MDGVWGAQRVTMCGRPAGPEVVCSSWEKRQKLWSRDFQFCPVYRVFLYLSFRFWLIIS